MTGLLVAGATSDAGKSVLVAGICRWLARQGVKVAPFKAQNMSLNSAVTGDGGEIGRAQAMQAAAARVEPEAAMNPGLLKPGGNGRSQGMVLGKPVAEADALSYRALKRQLLATVLDCLADLRGRFDAVVCEGIVVADIDRGGAFAALFGTLALLSRDDQALVAGFVINKFRGDQRLLDPGLAALRTLTGRPVLGVLPWTPGLWLDAEDSLDLGAYRAELPPAGRDTLRVAVVRLPHISNFTDADPLAAEPGVTVSFTTAPADVVAADLVIVPGSRATVADLAWLRRRGLADAITARAGRGRPVIGICAGFQMLARDIHDDVESSAGMVAGLALLPASVRFGPEKVLRRRAEQSGGITITGYEIRHGIVDVAGGDPFPGGCAAGVVRGTTWHGIFESDEFRRGLLRQSAAETGREFMAGQTSFEAVRQGRLDVLGDLVAEHLDTGALLRLIHDGAPAGLPFIPPGAP